MRIVIDGDKIDHLFLKDCFPFGIEMTERKFVSETYRWGFNGMERDDEFKGSGNSIDFGARMYDARLGRWMSRDPKEWKYASYSSFGFVFNNPILYLDLGGLDVYILVFTGGPPEFRLAALTRQRQIESMEGFDSKKDHVYLVQVSDFGTLKEEIKKSLDDAHANNFGETVEFSVWSHAGKDGPMGDVPTTVEDNNKDEFYKIEENQNQLSLNDWAKIDFNWDPDGSIAAFYGCNTATFALNFLKVQNVTAAAGQFFSAYPSSQPTVRSYPSSGFSEGDDVYFVGGTRGVSWIVKYTPYNLDAFKMKIYFQGSDLVGYAYPNIDPKLVTDIRKQIDLRLRMNELNKNTKTAIEGILENTSPKSVKQKVRQAKESYNGGKGGCTTICPKVQ